MSKHTPGPWFASFDKGWDAWQVDSVPAPFGNGICRVSNFDDAAEHDARLIAAAPEMLEALKFALEEMVNAGCGAAAIRLELAIAKAEGQS